MRAMKWLIAIPLPLLCFFGGALLGGLIIIMVGALLGTFIQDRWAIAAATELVFASGGLIFGIFLAIRLLDEPKADANSCEECGYNLTGNVSGRCPECGTEISSV